MNTLPFIEGLIVKYGLERELIENDPVLKEKLSGIEDYSDRVFIKFLYGEQLKNSIIKNIDIETPFTILKKIVDELISKKITTGELPQVLRERLKITSDMAGKIAEDITRNEEVISEMASIKIPEKTADENTKNLEERPEKNTKSIGYELLK